jgi:hypothetical protein
MKKVISIILMMISFSSHAKDHSEAVELAKLYLDRALSSQYVANDIKLMDDLTLMRDKFDGRVIIKNRRCTGRYSKYVAYILGSIESKNLEIFICNQHKDIPTESMAQTLIHEVSHVVISPDEEVATRFEMIVTYLGGRTPELTGHNSRQEFFDYIEEMSDKILKSRNMDYFILMNVRTKSKMRELLLRTFAIHEQCAQFQVVLKQLCSDDSKCEEHILAKKDEFGISVLDLNDKCRL